MKRIVLASLALVFSATIAYTAWMTNLNHHSQVRIPDGWNVESQVIIKDDKHAQVLLAAPENDEMVAAIFSMEVEQSIPIKDFKGVFENMMLKNSTIISEERRGFNNLKGILVLYEADFEGTRLKLLCFFTKKDQYLYAVFTGTLSDLFEEKKSYLEELIVTFQYVE